MTTETIAKTSVVDQINSLDEGLCIKCTTDYSIFKPHLLQRNLKPEHVAKITRSMQKRGFVPEKHVICNEDMQVVDGQHRLQAAKNLGLPVYYTVSAAVDVDDIREMAKTVAAWDLEDYVSSYIKQGNDNYRRVVDLKDLSLLGWNAFLGGAMRVTENDARADFKNGKFILTDRREQEVFHFIHQYHLFKDTFGGWKIRIFVAACSYIFSHPKYDHAQMTARLDYQRSKLFRCTTTDEYISMLSDIYNYKTHAKNVVDFSRAARGMR